MMQKILISRDKKAKLLTIKEFAVVDWHPSRKDLSSLSPNDFMLLNTETYPAQSITTAISEGKDALISQLRTASFYPIGPYADRIADSVIDLYRSNKDLPVELVLNDLELLPGAGEQ